MYPFAAISRDPSAEKVNYLSQSSSHAAILTCSLASPLIPMLSLCFLAAGVDPPHHSLAGEPDPREDHGGDAAEAGGLQGLQAPAQAPEGAGEVPAGN